MIQYRIDKETPDYITMDRYSLLYLCMEGKELPDDAYEEISDMVNNLVSFEYSAKEELVPIDSQYISEFKIRKDSALGKYLTANNGRNEIVDCTEYISYRDVCNAMLIAIVNDDEKMANKITSLVQKESQGQKQDLLKEFPFYEETLNFILENNDLEKHLAKKHGIENDEEKQEPFIAFENGEWAIKTYENKPLNRILAKQEEASNIES